MQSNPTPKYTLATNAQLEKQSHINRLKVGTASIGISDREWPTVIQNMLLEIDMQNGEIWTAPEKVEIPLIDDVWGEERWVRRFLESDRVVDPTKLRWLDLFFKVKFPQIARHFDR